MKEIGPMFLDMRGPIGKDDYLWVEKNMVFIADRSLERINNMDDFKEKNEFLLKVIGHFNEDESRSLEKYLSDCNLEEFYHELSITGIIIHIPSETKLSYQLIQTFYEENEWIKVFD